MYLAVLTLIIAVIVVKNIQLQKDMADMKRENQEKDAEIAQMKREKEAKITRTKWR